MIQKEIPCICLTGYKKFRNGSTGCILVVDWKTFAPSVFLFNSSERKDNLHNGLLSAEVEMLAQYEKECEKDGRLLMTPQEAYKKYGVARLCGDFLSAHIADLVCENLNTHEHQQFDTRRTREMLAGAHLQYKNRDLEDELLAYLDDDSEWQRSMLESTLPRIADNYNHKAWINVTLIKIRHAFIDTLQKMDIQSNVEFGFRLASAYQKEKHVKWWRVLEESVSMRYPEKNIEYSGHGIQEVIAFCALSRYIAKDQPGGNFTLGVEKLPQKQRIELFGIYKEKVEKECLTELQNTEDPSRFKMPDKAEAQKLAQERMALQLGKVPDWLPEENREIYAQYELAFCESAKIGDFDTTKVNSRAIYSKEKKGVRAVYKSGLCKCKADWCAVFMILREREICGKTSYYAGAKFINEACGKEVTSKDALRQSPAIYIIGTQNFERGWHNRDIGNREADGKLQLYIKIGQVFCQA